MPRVVVFMLARGLTSESRSEDQSDLLARNDQASVKEKSWGTVNLAKLGAEIIVVSRKLLWADLSIVPDLAAPWKGVIVHIRRAWGPSHIPPPFSAEVLIDPGKLRSLLWLYVEFCCETSILLVFAKAG